MAESLGSSRIRAVVAYEMDCGVRAVRIEITTKLAMIKEKKT